MVVSLVLHVDDELKGYVPVPGNRADVVVEARFERGLEDFDHFHALGHDEKVVGEDVALESIAVVNFKDKGGGSAWAGCTRQWR